MTQLSIKGYGTLVYVDDEDRQHGFGTFNKITQTGLDRILKADTALKNRSYVFHYIIATQNLPRDREVFTRAELEQYNAILMKVTREPVTRRSNGGKNYTINFDTGTTVNEYNNEVTCDTLSLAYTDDLDNFYICSYADYLNPATNATETFTVASGARILSSYRISLSIAKNLTGINLEFVDRPPMDYTTEFSGQYITSHSVENNIYINSTRLPYVDGSNKVKFDVVKNKGASWQCLLVTSMFCLDYRKEGNASTHDIVEIEFIQPEDAPAKLGTVIAAPAGITETIAILSYGSEGRVIEFKADPLSTVEFYFNGGLISKCITDASGFGSSIFSFLYYDPVAQESRQLDDGLLLNVKTINSLGTFEQTYIPIDTVANKIKHWNWIDNTHLRVVGRLGDIVKIYIATGYTADGVELTNIEVANVTLTLPDTRYGYDAAYADVALDIYAQYPIFYTSTVKVNVTDAAGNTYAWYDVRISQDGLNLPNLFEFSQSERYTKTLNKADSLYRIPLITKGSKA